jgi:hypothetical protein
LKPTEASPQFASAAGSATVREAGTKQTGAGTGRSHAELHENAKEELINYDAKKSAEAHEGSRALRDQVKDALEHNVQALEESAKEAAEKGKHFGEGKEAGYGTGSGKGAAHEAGKQGEESAQQGVQSAKQTAGQVQGKAQEVGQQAAHTTRQVRSV